MLHACCKVQALARWCSAMQGRAERATWFLFSSSLEPFRTWIASVPWSCPHSGCILACQASQTGYP